MTIIEVLENKIPSSNLIFLHQTFILMKSIQKSKKFYKLFNFFKNLWNAEICEMLIAEEQWNWIFQPMPLSTLQIYQNIGRLKKIAQNTQRISGTSEIIIGKFTKID